MALHHELPIYKTGTDLLSLALRVQEQMPRSMKRALGEKITTHCIEQAVVANALRRRGHCVAGNLAKVYRCSP